MSLLKAHSTGVYHPTNLTSSSVYISGSPMSLGSLKRAKDAESSRATSCPSMAAGLARRGVFTSFASLLRGTSFRASSYRTPQGRSNRVEVRHFVYYVFPVTFGDDPTRHARDEDEWHSLGNQTVSDRV